MPDATKWKIVVAVRRVKRTRRDTTPGFTLTEVVGAETAADALEETLLRAHRLCRYTDDCCARDEVRETGTETRGKAAPGGGGR